MFTQLASLAWWKAAGLRALRTPLAMLLASPLLTAQASAGAWAEFAQTAAIAALYSLLTSMASLPEIDDTPRPWWAAMLDRGVKQFAQVFAAGLTAALLFSDVAWTTLLTQAALSAAGSLVLAVISMLPEAQPMPANKVVQVVGTDGSIVAGPASPLPTGTVINAGKHVA